MMISNTADLSAERCSLRTHTPQSVGSAKEYPPHYAVKLAQTREEVRAAQMLRFLVFNLELNEGLDQSYFTCLDADPFDEVCDHLIVQDLAKEEVVGTYRLQTGRNAALHRGYYSEQEFDLSPLAGQRECIIELGRACIHQGHRNLTVLNHLWRGIAHYAETHQGRYLIGCSSLSTVDSRLGAAVYRTLARDYLAAPEFRVRPRPAWACPLEESSPEVSRAPKLLAAYLALGAKICGPPAIDQEFKTIDFLTLLDLQALSPRASIRYRR